LVINRPLSPLAEDFIKFALSTPAQKMLTDEGLIAEQ
jgi:ABC-type molybdate transport system substrate-binding protein